MSETNETKQSLIDAAEHWKNFFKEYQTPILFGAVAILALKNRGLRRDINTLASATEDTVKAAHLMIDGMQAFERDLGWLGADSKEIAQHFDELYERTNELAAWQNVAQGKIEDLEKTKTDMFTQFFGERKS